MTSFNVVGELRDPTSHLLTPGPTLFPATWHNKPQQGLETGEDLALSCLNDAYQLQETQQCLAESDIKGW